MPLIGSDLLEAGVDQTLYTNGITEDYNNASGFRPQGDLWDVGAFESPAPPPAWNFGYPKLGTIAGSSVEILGSIDQNGSGYAVALNDGASAPTSAQVIAGTDASDVIVPSTAVSMALDIEESISIGELKPLKKYDIYVVARADFIMDNPTKLDILTPPLVGPPPQGTRIGKSQQLNNTTFKSTLSSKERQRREMIRNYI